MQRQRCFSAGFRPVDFDHAAARNAERSQRNIQAQRPGGYCRDIGYTLRTAQFHNGPFAELSFNLRDG